ncbi:uncharacterized protein LOC141588234 [Silene latifolia]|uniref:uncharacterized protein LOC141588234 n=1 Tax=Silene latifolia TaxID=37657 RepID=UPI003D77EB8E
MSQHICKVKGLMSSGYVNNHWIHDPKGYSIKSGYGLLQGGHPSVGWYKDVWDAWCFPKHSIICWLIQHEALNIREKLFRLQISDSNQCVLCENGTETHEHLFYRCKYGEKIKNQLEEWLQIQLDPNCMGISMIQQRVCRMALVAFWYCLWIERNSCRMEQRLKCPERLVQEIKRVLCARIQLKLAGGVRLQDKN